MLLAWAFGADASFTFVILTLALALDAALGESLFRRAPHPVAAIGRATAALDARLNRPGLGQSALRRRGALAVALVAGAAAAAGLALALAFGATPWLWIAEALAVSTLLAARSLYDHVRAVAVALDGAGLEAGRAAVAHIVGRDPAARDRHGEARAPSESLAENGADPADAHPDANARLAVPVPRSGIA
ncbi:MAG: cobalamin biosynthesis protein, partial [Rhodospirillales bacterium]